MSARQSQRRIPLRLKIAWTLFLVVWAPLYWKHYGLLNFLWFCDLANILIALALWTESPLLLSSQAVSILVVQTGWVLDVLGRMVFGVHFIGGTEYMFIANIPFGIRMLSLFHVVTPVMVLWAIGRTGYDGKGWILQTGIAWVVLPVCYLFTGPDRNINWVWGLSGMTRTGLSPTTYFCLIMAAYPLLLYLPAHLVFHRIYSK